MGRGSILTIRDDRNPDPQDQEGVKELPSEQTTSDFELTEASLIDELEASFPLIQFRHGEGPLPVVQGKLTVSPYPFGEIVRNGHRSSENYTADCKLGKKVVESIPPIHSKVETPINRRSERMALLSMDPENIGSHLNSLLTALSGSLDPEAEKIWKMLTEGHQAFMRTRLEKGWPAAALGLITLSTADEIHAIALTRAEKEAQKAAVKETNDVEQIYNKEKTSLQGDIASKEALIQSNEKKISRLKERSAQLKTKNTRLVEQAESRLDKDGGLVERIENALADGTFSYNSLKEQMFSSSSKGWLKRETTVNFNPAFQQLGTLSDENETVMLGGREFSEPKLLEYMFSAEARAVISSYRSAPRSFNEDIEELLNFCGVAGFNVQDHMSGVSAEDQETFIANLFLLIEIKRESMSTDGTPEPGKVPSTKLEVNRDNILRRGVFLDPQDDQEVTQIQKEADRINLTKDEDDLEILRVKLNSVDDTHERDLERIKESINAQTVAEYQKILGIRPNEKVDLIHLRNSIGSSPLIREVLEATYGSLPHCTRPVAYPHFIGHYGLNLSNKKDQADFLKEGKWEDSLVLLLTELFEGDRNKAKVAAWALRIVEANSYQMSKARALGSISRELENVQPKIVDLLSNERASFMDFRSLVDQLNQAEKASLSFDQQLSQEVLPAWRQSCLNSIGLNKLTEMMGIEEGEQVEIVTYDYRGKSFGIPARIRLENGSLSEESKQEILTLVLFSRGTEYPVFFAKTPT